MPPTYLCEGSISCLFHQPSNQVDVLSISVYKDTSGHPPIREDHYNLFLQHQINGKIDHTKKIPNRHIPLRDGVVIKALVDGKEVKKQRIKLIF